MLKIGKVDASGPKSVHKNTFGVDVGFGCFYLVSHVRNQDALVLEEGSFGDPGTHGPGTYGVFAGFGVGRLR
jgi:hypothetical protein